jgi:hypothetical protein
MVLVPHDTHNTNKLHPVTPVGEKIVSLDEEMENILKNDSLTDAEKVTRYTNIMQKFMDYQKQYKPPNIQVTPSGAAGEMQNGGGGVGVIQNIDDTPHTTQSEDIPPPSTTEKNTPTPNLESGGIVPTPLKGEEVGGILPTPSIKTGELSSKHKKKKAVEYFFSNYWLVCE